ncbi:MAG TPA: aminopeptidase N C-terminal domain-containing protein, partial [Geminicoccaceae bacterium]|nr:aminopeptidase N C-terminal domain-containing protein [Geminicoccaceae bacterium]
EPVPSLFRGFSAPVKLEAGYGDAELGVLLRHDEDPFCRWEAGQTLALRLRRELGATRQVGVGMSLDPVLREALGEVLARSDLEPAYRAQAVTLPSANYLAQQLPVIDPDAVSEVRGFVRAELGRALHARWREQYEANREDGPFSIEPAAMGRRALKNVALAYLLWAGKGEGAELALAQYRGADNMTDRLAALRGIAEAELPEAEAALGAFYERWQSEPLVVNKWFGLQATLERPDSVELVAALMRHPAFTLKNPNRVRALLGSFATSNLPGFHRRDGAGYRLVVDSVLELDPKNPSVAARLLTALGRWRRFDPARQALMKAELERVLAKPGLSRDSYEIASKSLA